MALKSISQFCGSNLPGIITIDYAPVDWMDLGSYETIVSETRNWQYAIPFAQGDWLKLPLYPGDRLWEEKERSNPQGKYYEMELLGVTPKLRPEVTQQFEEMSELDFLLKLTDRNRQTWLLGTIVHPFRMETNARSGNRGQGRNQYNVRFYSQSPRRAYGYLPVF